MGGKKAGELGECVASREGMGHSCWAIAGTLCKNKVQGNFAQKKGFCSNCKVYKLYNRVMGTKGEAVIMQFPEEHSRYEDLILQNNSA